jgi:hypothetical protein
LDGLPFSDPAKGGTANVIPASRINSFAKVLIPLFTPPNKTMDAFGNIAFAPSRRRNINHVSLRTDHVISASDSVFGRFTYADDDIHIPALHKLSGSTSPIFVRNTAFGWTHTISPIMVSEFRFGYDNSDAGGTFPEKGFDMKAAGFRNISSICPECQAPPGVGITGINAAGSGGTVFDGHESNFYFYENLAWTKGKHSLSFGGQFARLQHLIRNDLVISGSVGYNGNFLTGLPYSGSSVADFVLGHPSSLVLGVGSTAGHHTGFWPSLYVNDIFHLTPKLTLNMGLRYEMRQPLVPTEHNDRWFDPSIGTQISGGDKGVPLGIADRDWNDLAPRFGFAYKVTDKFVIRSGYGIYYDIIPGDELSFATMSAPNFALILRLGLGDPNAVRVTVGEGLPTDFLPSVDIKTHADTGLSVSGGDVGAGSTDPLFMLAADRHRRTSYLQQWNYSIQYSLPSSMLFEAAYVGNKGTKMSKRVDINLARPLTGPLTGDDDPLLNPQNRRPYPNWGAILQDTSRGKSTYHSLQVKLEKAPTHGLMFIMGYTWGKALTMDDYDALGSRNYHWSLLSSDYTHAIFDRKHRLTFSTSYDLPFAKNRQGIAHQVLGGWSISSINQFMSGSFFGAQTSLDYADIGSFFNWQEPDRICNGNLPPSERTPEHWFDTKCFVPPNGTVTAPNYPHLGNSSYNILETDGVVTTDFALSKEWGRERFKVQFRAELFNAFNHPNFKQADGNIDSGTYGAVLGALEPREVQFGLKFLW